jgi:hypothetical protein
MNKNNPLNRHREPLQEAWRSILSGLPRRLSAPRNDSRKKQT